MGLFDWFGKKKKEEQPVLGKSGKKICCSCPETKQARDECTIQYGPEAQECQEKIEAHKQCLRAEGFNV